MSVVVAWSGGADSTYTLMKLLKTTEEQIDVIHLVLSYTKGFILTEDKLFLRNEFFKREAEAVDKLTPILQNIRPFNVYKAKLVFDYSEGNNSDQALFFAAQFASKRKDVTAIYLGWNYNEVYGTGTKGYNKEQRQLKDEQLMNGALFLPLDSTRKVEYKLFSPTRKEQREYLGEEIWNITWGCADPLGPGYSIPCGKCFGCLERKESENAD